jgi:hypothetical protein
MYKGDQTKGTTTPIAITSGNSVVWAADEATTVDVTFPRATWAGNIILQSSIGSGQSVFLRLGRITGGAFQVAKSQEWISGGTETTIPISILPDSAFTVNSGDYLAFKIENASGNDTLQVEIKNQSQLVSPGSDPGYPVSELPTIIFLATGLVGLAAYLGLKRHRRVVVRA